MDLKNTIKVYQIKHDGNKGWVTNNPEDFREEIELFMAEDKELVVDVDKTIKNIKKLEAGEGYRIKCFTFECNLMDEEKYNSLEEFPGW